MYKNLSKSLICMLMPMLVACGGKVNKTDTANALDAPRDGVAVLHTLEMDSVIMQYNHEMDSIDAVANRWDAAGKAYGDMYKVCQKDLADFMSRYPYINSTPKEQEALEKYLTENCAAMVDSAYNYDWKSGYVAQDKKNTKMNAPLEAVRPEKTARDSIRAEHDRADAAARCYLDVWLKVLHDYKQECANRTVWNNSLRAYQAKKLLELSDSVAVYRGRKKMLAKKVFAQNVK